MKLEEHVVAAIDAYYRGSKNEALLHGCMAIDGTSRNLFGVQQAGKNEYKKCIRTYWWLLERFLPGIDLEKTKWNNLKIDNGQGKDILNPDLADVIYHIYRCNHAHGKEVPVEYDLLPLSKDGDQCWIVGVSQDARLQLPEGLIWALLAVSIFSSGNARITTNSDHYLTWESPAPKKETTKFVIKEWWGREKDLAKIFDPHPQTKILLKL